MCTYIFFSARRYIALTANVKVRTDTPKMARNKQVFLCTKSHTGSKFSKTSLRLLCTWGTVVVHLYCVRWRHSRPPNFEPLVFVNSVAIWGRIASAVMNRFECSFLHLLEDQMFFIMHWTFHSYVGRWRHKFRKVAEEIFQNVKIRPQTCAKYFLWLLYWHCN